MDDQTLNESTPNEPTRPLCDYEGSGYRQEFWEGQGRDYEDLTERVAMRRLLPPRGRRAVHLGAGFGRMTNELSGYDQVIVLDYSRTMLREAQQFLDASERYIFVAADVYYLPLADGSCDTAVMERVIHHLADVPAALRQIRAVLAPGSPFVLEYASKRNLKAILRYWLKRQSWDPFDHAPVEFVKLNFDFHPAYMAQCLSEAGFLTERRLAVSYFRLGLLKRVVPLAWLVALDRLLQPTGEIAPFSPSVFTLNFATGDMPPHALDGPLFKCLRCGELLHHENDMVVCDACGARWAIRDGIYDFKDELGD
ncbi:MAG: methyltransferase domain-containing protein [Anaerolineae bacterium]|nr:methyltransferase domain-containing protein [Anaerolineae bacterium]